MRGPAKQSLCKLVNSAHENHRLCVPQTQAQRRQLSRGVECGLLVRPFPGVYASAERWHELSPEEKVLFAARALQEMHPGWVFAGTTAALAYGLSVSWNCLDMPTVATVRTSQARGRGRIHRIAVTKDLAVERDGLRVTSFVRTVYDCLRAMPFSDALALADSACRMHGIDGDRLQVNVARLCGRLPGAKRACAIAHMADPRSESGGESIARAQMIALGFAVPDLQREIADPIAPGKGYRADFAWDLPDGTVVIGELDGREKYENKEMLNGMDVEERLLRERRRESRITNGKRPVRIMRFSLPEVKNAAEFERLLVAYGVPRAIAVPEVAELALPMSHRQGY